MPHSPRTKHVNLAIEDYCNAATWSDEVQAALDVAREIPAHLRVRLN